MSCKFHLVAQAIRTAIRANHSRESFAIETPVSIARRTDSHESLEFPLRANRPIRANRAKRFARITPPKVATFEGGGLGDSPFLARFPFFLWGDPVQNRPQNPAPASCLFSTRKSRCHYHARRKPVRSNSWGSKPDTDTDT